MNALVETVAMNSRPATSRIFFMRPPPSFTNTSSSVGRATSIRAGGTAIAEARE